MISLDRAVVTFIIVILKASESKMFFEMQQDDSNICIIYSIQNRYFCILVKSMNNSSGRCNVTGPKNRPTVINKFDFLAQQNRQINRFKNQPLHRFVVLY